MKKLYEYAEVDSKVVLDVLNSRLSDFKKFVNYIEEYLGKG